MFHTIIYQAAFLLG
ncbi:hypothetical protein Pint_21528 [Pistacia integerrima]|uniref:Uncharacterized protein n=1 Tax=Pistacia integerrima TaxID=434235 RepID=A0ACC0XAM4_9ROSI|nr:hypothetical protein Pint_21528 [Pistacia integerrima]